MGSPWNGVTRDDFIACAATRFTVQELADYYGTTIDSVTGKCTRWGLRPADVLCSGMPNAVQKVSTCPQVKASLPALSVSKGHLPKDVPRKHLIIPDTQVRPGVPTDHFVWIGRYIRDKKPDVIIHLGDHWDMPSLSSYDKGKRAAENRRYIADIEAGNQALRVLHEHMGSSQARKVILRGNHEARIERAAEDSAWLEGTIGYHQFNDVELGWEPVPFLQPIIIDGIKYAHYFCRGANGKVGQTKRGMASARVQVMREGISATAGHSQGLDVARMSTDTGTRRGLIAGSCYQHDEGYMGPQGNNHWRGILVKHRVAGGNYDLCEVSLDYLKEKYG